MQKIRYISCCLFLLSLITLARAQTVTQVQWWFDDDYSSSVTESATGSDFVWRKNIQTHLLHPGFHRLNLRFKDNADYWSGTTSHYFLKLDGEHSNVISHFEYWFGDNYAESHSIPLSTVDLPVGDNSVAIFLNLPMDTVANGLHQLNFRVGYVNGFHSAISTTFFYKCDNVISLGNTVFEYWMDNNFDGRTQKNFINSGGMNTFDLDLSGFKEEGMHRLNYRIGNEQGGFGSIYTHYFFNNRQGAKVLEWTFDDNPTVYSRSLSGSQEYLIFDLPTGNLSNGVHAVHFRTGHQNGNYSTPTTAHFVKGTNPYAPALQDGEQLLTEYIYWFDNELETDVTETITPTQKYALNADIEMPENLSRGNHVFNIKAKDSYGQWGETLKHPFTNTTGQITTAHIKNLEPNINPPFPLSVKEYATIYRYYMIVDDNDVPIPNAQIEYKVGDYIDYSDKSDERGIVTIAFDVWGKDVDDTKDDYIPCGTSKRMEFLKLLVDNQDVTAKTNALADFNFIDVQQYQSDESTMGITLGMGAEGAIGSNLKAGASLDTKISFTNKYEEFMFKGTTYTLEGSGKINGSVSNPPRERLIENKILYNLLGGFPSFKPKGSFEAELTGKFKQEMEISADAGWKTYLAIFYDLVYWTYVNANCTSENLDVILNTLGNYLNTLGNYLSDEDYQQNKESKWGFNATLSGSSSFNLNYAPTEVITLPNGYMQPPLWYDKGDIDVGIKLSGKVGFESGGGYKSQRSQSNYTQYNFLSFAIEGSAEISANKETGFNIPNTPNEQYGASVGGTASSSVKFSREHPDNSLDIEKADLTLGRGQDVELKVNYGFYTGTVKPSKEYSYKYSINKPVFDYLHNHSDLLSSLPASAKNTWLYLDNKDNLYSKISLPFTHIFSDYEDDLTALFKKIDSQNTPNLNKSVSLTGTKKYTGSLDIKKRIGTPKWLDWFGNFEVYIHGGLSLEGKYPLSESYWHFGLDTIIPVIKYRETSPFSSLNNFGKEASYYFAPFDRTDEAITNLDGVIEKIKSSLYQKWDDAKEKARNVLNGWYNTYTSRTEKGLTKLLLWLGPWSYSDAPPQNMNRVASMPASRRYSPMLSSYKQLTENPQSDISTMLFEIPCENNEVFNEYTEINFNHYYPGGEVLGATNVLDTFVVISEIAFLSAIHKWDTLTVAPNGNFKIFATAGADDLSFLDLNSNYPIGVYHKAFADSLWHSIGNVNDTIYFNELGKFCLGVSVNDDNESPVINISKEENADIVEITVTDNMAVYWKNVMVLLNGVVTEYKRNGSLLQIQLSEEQLQRDIYVTVYASDLARNEAQATAIFEGPEIPDGIKTIIRQSACQLYPNPATDICRLLVPNELRNEKTAYAIVNPLGKVFHREQIKNEETMINISPLSTGVYFIVVYDDNQIIENLRLLKK